MHVARNQGRIPLAQTQNFSALLLPFSCMLLLEILQGSLTSNAQRVTEALPFPEHMVASCERCNQP